MSSTEIQMLEKKAQALLAPFGLHGFGWFDADGKAGLLIGNVGSGLWPVFSNSPEFHDGEPNAMDRWTTNAMSPIAEELGSEVRFPFGETVWPFQHYAKAATGMEQSPIGLLIHSQYGLWIAFRAALIFEFEMNIGSPENKAHPCDSCLEKPCLTTCPIDAFSEQGYDYVACKSYVKSDEGSVCYTGGCRARHACPIGRDYVYEAAHQAFHMKAFV